MHKAQAAQISELLPNYINGMLMTFGKYSINTKLRQAHFLAQMAHETGGFKWNRELWGPTKAQRGYEGRIDLGNTEVGDGSRFRGRSWVMVTGRYNYTQISRELGEDFLLNPELLEQDPYATLAAGWYWNSRYLNKLADEDNLLAITKRINGGTNGLEDRKQWYHKIRHIL